MKLDLSGGVALTRAGVESKLNSVEALVLGADAVAAIGAVVVGDLLVERVEVGLNGAVVGSKLECPSSEDLRQFGCFRKGGS